MRVAKAKERGKSLGTLCVCVGEPALLQVCNRLHVQLTINTPAWRITDGTFAGPTTISKVAMPSLFKICMQTKMRPRELLDSYS